MTVARYLLGCLCVFVVSTSPFQSAFAQDTKAPEVYVHPESKLQFPANLGNSRRLSVQNYQDPRLGIAVTYQVSGLGRADFYVYQSNQGSVPNGINSDSMPRPSVATDSSAPSSGVIWSQAGIKEHFSRAGASGTF